MFAPYDRYIQTQAINMKQNMEILLYDLITNLLIDAKLKPIKLTMAQYHSPHYHEKRWYPNT